MSALNIAASRHHNHCPGCSEGGSNDNHPTNLCCLRCRNFSAADSQAAMWPRNELLVEMDSKWKAIAQDFQKSGVDLSSDSARLMVAVDTITEGLETKVDKARALFTWISANIVYDNDSGGVMDAIKVLEGGKCICRGYAKLYFDLAQSIQLPCAWIHGQSKTGTFHDFYSSSIQPATNADDQGNHGWNAFQMDDGSIKLLDATWGSNGEIGDGTQPVINFHYFTMSNDEFLLDHFPIMQHHQLDPLPEGVSLPSNSHLEDATNPTAQANYVQWLSTADPPTVLNSDKVDIIDRTTLRPSTRLIEPTLKEVIRNKGSETGYSIAEAGGLPVYGLDPTLPQSGAQSWRVNLASCAISIACPHQTTIPLFFLVDKHDNPILLHADGVSRNFCIDNLKTSVGISSSGEQRSFTNLYASWRDEANERKAAPVVCWEVPSPAIFAPPNAPARPTSAATMLPATRLVLQPPQPATLAALDDLLAGLDNF